MSKKAVRIVEWTAIGAFIAIVVWFASTMIYRAVINSDWYGEYRLKKGFAEMTEKVNEHGKIKYIGLYKGELEYIHEFPEALFDDVSCEEFVRIEDVDERHRIFASDSATVFFEDGSTVSFFITDEGELYWDDYVKIKCQSLMDWFYEK